ncbi:placenta-specific gene 8 protein-like [Gigantopelta aegis]|uniref:placenta-specific gene 8 protein-like n=1 Tax=Gigantopelta aegis TaxID=1735272 RepID=UPI001B889753|nr:placenta-specific gene 8 protein-like [Gigantopelta aegis]
MATITVQPGAQLLVPPGGTRDWNAGLCGCMSDCKSLLCTYFGLPCMLCDLSRRTEECVCMTCCVPGGLIALRARIRTMGGIQGSVCKDCMVVSCCGPCSVCQMSRELDNMGL